MDGVALTSRLDAVTIYQRDAVCVRRAVLAPGASQLRVTGLPLSLVPGSLRARVEGAESGGPVVLQVQPGVEVALVGEADRPAAERALEVAREADARTRAALARVQAALAETEALRVKNVESRRGEPPREAHVDTMLELVALVDRRLAHHLGERRRLHEEAEATARELQLCEARVAELSSAERGESAKVSRCLTVTLSAPPEKELALLIEYVVPGVRWAPSYALQLNPLVAGGTLRMHAAVAQATGEDWTGVRLALATAPLLRVADVPVLRSSRIGRVQEPPAPSGWREPPPGLDALFESYEEERARRPTRSFPFSFAAAVAAAPAPEPAMKPKPARMQKQALGAPLPAPPPAPSPSAMALPPPASMARRSAAPAAAYGGAVGGLRMRGAAPSPGGPPEPEEESAYAAEGSGDPGELSPAAPSPAEPCLDYPRLVMRRGDDEQRGRLMPATGIALELVSYVSVSVTEVVQVRIADAALAASRVADMPLPQSRQEARSLQSFDCVYECADRVDVPAHGTWIHVPVMACEVALVSRFVCVPAIDPHVFRVLSLRNVSAHALLPGPVDVSLGGTLLLSTSLPGIPPGGETDQLGLGVEEGLKVARNVAYRETSGGILGGTSVLAHTLDLEVKSGLAVPAALEILERIPVAEEGQKDIAVQESAVQPPWEPLKEVEGGLRTIAGGRRWRVEVPAHGKAQLKATYSVRIPSDRMLVGGNRRA